ncbi:hypothetical protein IJJ05_01510 [Candidatus Saccharibacteria bacterium]|nr:hypothetical protein [Candidatus Saccharibacteria bacterium]
MKKRWFGLVLVLILVVALCAACGEVDVVTGDDVPDEEEFEENIEETMAREAEEAAEEETNSGSNIAEDELAVLRVTEEMAREAEGVYLKRGENYYTFGNDIPYKTLGVRYNDVAVFNAGGAIIFYNANEYINLGIYEMYALGDVPVPVLKNSDLVVGFYSGEVNNCRLYPAEEIGYSLYIDKLPDDSVTFFDDNAHIMKNVDGRNCELKDINGNLVEDNRRLEKGETYIFSWYNGSQYNEVELTCMGRSYDAKNRKEDCIVIEPQFTQEGYVIYDFSSLAPGLYRVNDFGLVRIE